MLPGITLRSREMSTLEQIRMTVTATPMPRPLKNEVVMAMVEHIPKKLGKHWVLGKQALFQLSF